MKTRATELIDAELATLRAWCAGLDAQAAVARYLGDPETPGASARGVLGRIRRALVVFATSRHRADLAEPFGERSAVSADTVARAIAYRAFLRRPTPREGRAVARLLRGRVAADPHRCGRPRMVLGWSTPAAQRDK
jgi:hypothetical protein